MKKIKEKIKNLEIVVLDINDKMVKTAKMTEVQTIAKHVMNLEARVEELEKEQKSECYTKINPNIEVSYITASQVNDIIKEINRAKPQTDYFLKAKNLLIEYAEKTMIKKGIEYTPTGDRFANFRPMLGEKKTAIEKLIGYNAKHVQYCYMQETKMTAKTINELLEHWGDVFNYNVLGLAMENTDKPSFYTVPYADRLTQEKEIQDIVESIKSVHTMNFSDTDNDIRYKPLLSSISRNNLFDIIYLFAKQLERLEGK